MSDARLVSSEATQIPQEVTMIRALVISLAVAALAMSAAPLAPAAGTPPQVIVLIGANDYGVVSEGSSKAKGPRSGSFVDIGTTETLDMRAAREPRPRRTATSAFAVY